MKVYCPKCGAQGGLSFNDDQQVARCSKCSWTPYGEQGISTGIPSALLIRLLAAPHSAEKEQIIRDLVTTDNPKLQQTLVERVWGERHRVRYVGGPAIVCYALIAAISCWLLYLLFLSVTNSTGLFETTGAGLNAIAATSVLGIAAALWLMKPNRHAFDRLNKTIVGIVGQWQGPDRIAGLAASCGDDVLREYAIDALLESLPSVTAKQVESMSDVTIRNLISCLYLPMDSRDRRAKLHTGLAHVLGMSTNWRAAPSMEELAGRYSGADAIAEKALRDAAASVRKRIRSRKDDRRLLRAAEPSNEDLLRAATEAPMPDQELLRPAEPHNE